MNIWKLPCESLCSCELAKPTPPWTQWFTSHDFFPSRKERALTLQVCYGSSMTRVSSNSLFYHSWIVCLTIMIQDNRWNSRCQSSIPESQLLKKKSTSLLLLKSMSLKSCMITSFTLHGPELSHMDTFQCTKAGKWCCLL